MSLIKYEIFRTAAEVGSLSKAAEVLKLTQSAVSHAIAGLEDELGFSLLIRSRHGTTLTQNGEKILIHVQEILKCQEQLLQEAAKINGLESGIVRIGVFPSVSIHWIPQIIKNFTEEFPLIEIKLYEGNYDDISKWIMEGKIDFGFLSLPVPRSFDTIPIQRDPLLCIVPESHRLYDCKTISIEQLQEEDFIMPKSSIDNDVRRIFSKHRITPDIRYEIAEDQAIIAMVQNGLGVSILPGMIVYRLPEGVRAIPLEGDHSRTIGIAAATFDYMSPSANTLIAFIREWIQ